MSDDGPGTREVAYRLFAAEFDDATLSYSESDEERAPNYVVTPTGLRVNRLFAVGVLTEVEHINDDTRRGRVVDPTGAFVTYAGQYQPDEQTFLERADPPSFVSITGKARTFEPEDSDRVFTSVRPESLNEVDAETRDRWTVTAAEATLDRLAVFAKALDSDLRGDDLRAALEAGGAPAALGAGVPRALDHYRTSPAYLEAVRRMAVDALEVVAGDRDDVRAPDLAPDEGGAADIGPLPDTDVVVDETVISESEPSADVATAAADANEAEDATGEEAATEAATDETAAEAEPATTEGASTDASPSTETAAESADDVTETTDATAGTESSDAAVETSTTAPADEPESPDVESTESDGLDEFDDELETDTEVDEPAEPSGTSTDTADDLGSFDAESETVDEGPSTAESVAEPGVESGSETGSTMGEDGPVAGGTDGEEDMYELDEEEREEIESEFGTDFSTGTEVEEPGEADIDVPDPEELDELEAEEGGGAGAEADTEPVADEAIEPESAAEPSATDESETAEAETDDEQAAEDVDLEDAVVDAMTDLDDGDGADREAVVAAVVDEYGVDPSAVEDAIQDALMGGQCYEPGEGTLKAI
ncbi:MAG: hypothetical protein ABEH81_00385 [Halopenitus sp.]